MPSKRSAGEQRFIERYGECPERGEERRESTSLGRWYTSAVDYMQGYEDAEEAAKEKAP